MEPPRGTRDRSRGSAGLRALGKWRFFVGFSCLMLVLIGAVVLIKLIVRGRVTFANALIDVVIVVVLFLVGLRVLRVGVTASVRGRRALSASAVLEKASAAPVLYLRSFAHDTFADRRPMLGSWSEEEQMVAVLRRIGPVVAIGAPGEQVPTLGAARDYVSDADWQDWVRAMMSRASLVLFRASETEAFWWEVKTASTDVAPERCAFLLPQDPEAYSRFRARIAEHWGQPLPERLPALPQSLISGPYAIEFWGLLYFETDGTPVLRRVDPIGFWIALSIAFVQPFRVYFSQIFAPLIHRTRGRRIDGRTLWWMRVQMLNPVTLFVRTYGVLTSRRRARKPVP